MKRLAAALVLIAGCTVTPPQPAADTVTVDRAELSTLLLTLMSEHQARLVAEKELAAARAKSGCI